MNLGGGEILVIIIVAVFIFGPDKLPQLFRFFGRVTAEIKDFQNLASEEINKISQENTTEAKTSTFKSNKSTSEYIDEGIVHPILDDEKQDKTSK